MTFKPEETYVIHNIIDPRPVQRTGPELPLTLVNRTNCYAKWIITKNSDKHGQYMIQNAATNCYIHLHGKAAVTACPSPLTHWKIEVVSPCMYRIYDPESHLFWTTHADSHEIFLEPFSPGCDQWWAISSEHCD